MKIIGLIPARRGSKRIPGKNLVQLNGKPLLQYAIDGANESGVFDRIVVSTDWDSCAMWANRLGVDALIRPDWLCTDQATDFNWVGHALECNPGFDVFVILRPTSPFRTADTIRRAVAQFEMQFCHSLRAVSRTPAHPKKSWEIVNGRMYPCEEGGNNGTPYYDLPTQALGDVWVQNGCIHVAWTDVLQDGTVSGELIRPFYTYGNEGIDINSPADLKYAKWIMGEGR